MTSLTRRRSRPRARALRAAAAAAAIAVALTGCGAYGPSPSPSTSTSAPSPSPTPTPTPTVDPLAGLDLRQRVGQLFIVGAQIDAATPATMSAVTDRHAGGTFLHGRSQAGAAAVADPAFAQRVDDAARHVLAAKAARP